MQLISMSTHLRLRDKKNKLEEYQKTLKRMFFSVKNNVPEWSNNLFFPDQTNENVLIVLVGSQKGLCGTFNTNVLYEFEKYILQEQFKHGSIITVGKKITEYFNLKLKPAKYPLTLLDSHNELSWTTLPTVVQKLVATITKAKPAYSRVLIYSNYPAGFFMQKPQVSTIIPLSLDKVEQGDTSQQTDFVWEDNPHHILDALAHHQLNATVYALLVQSFFAEQAARFISMDNATRNAKHLKEAMLLQYNKLRQAKITKELTELSSSFQRDFGT